MIDKALTRLGIEFELQGNEAVALCPMHEQRTGRVDSTPGWSMNIDTGLFQCFSCGYRGHITRLVRDLMNLKDFAEAAQWLQGAGVTGDEVKQTYERRKAQRVKRAVAKVDEAEFLAFDEVSEDMAASRDLNVQTCQFFGLRAHGDAWIIPIRDIAGKLLGWQEKNPQWVRNRPIGVKKGSCLFGYDLVAGEQVVVVESPLDAALARMHGVEAVATFGASVTEAQLSMIATRSPILAFDNDDAGRDSTKKVSAELTRLGVRHRLVQWDDPAVKDFGDAPERISDYVWASKDPLKIRFEQIMAAK